MTSPSVPTAEEFAKARRALRDLWPHRGYPVSGTAYYSILLDTLASAEAAIERLSKEAARWEAVREDLAVEPYHTGWRFIGNNYDPYPNPLPVSVDEAVDRLVSPPESEKP